MRPICAYTSVCEEDALLWGDQYLAEVTRLDVPFGINFDRCSWETKSKFMAHPLCYRASAQDASEEEFTEQHKQVIFDMVRAVSAFKFLMAWDVDETFEREAPAKLSLIEHLKDDYASCVWVNLWEDDKHIRIDGPLNYTMRVKFYSTRHKWKFDHPITNGAKCVDLVHPGLAKTNLVCLHHGLKTHELRVQHKKRWDRIYTAAVGSNPYGIWDYVLDPENLPTVAEHNF